MPVVMLIAILVVLGGIVAVALGRGGELSQEPPDFAPMDMGPVSATDVVLLRPPTALWGYNMQVTDDALERIAAAIRERDVRIVALEQRVSDLADGEHYAPLPSTARHARRAPAEDRRDEPADTVSIGPEPAPEEPAKAAPEEPAKAAPEEPAKAAPEEPAKAAPEEPAEVVAAPEEPPEPEAVADPEAQEAPEEPGESDD